MRAAQSTPMTLPDSLPASWRVVSLGRLAEINPRAARLARDDDAPTTFVPMAAVDGENGTIADAQLRPYAEVRKGYTRFAEGDVLFAKISPCMQNGKHAIARGLTDRIGFGTTEFHVIRPGADVLPEWVHLYIRQPSLLRSAKSLFYGSVGQQRLPASFLEQLRIPLPRLSEQKRIAAALREQLDAVARLRAAASNQARLAKATDRAHLRAVWEGQLSRSWPLRRLEEVALLERGKFTPRPRNDPRYYGGMYPWIQTGDVEAAGKHVTKYGRTLNGQGLAVSKLFPSGTLVMTIAASVGAVAILGFDSCMPDSLIGIAPREGLADSEFLYYTFLHIRSQLESLAPKTAQANLKLATLNPLQVRIPCLEEQRRVVKQLNERFVWTRRLSGAAEEQVAHAAALRAAVLCRAFTGGL